MWPLLLAVAASSCTTLSGNEDPPRVVTLEARRFAYTPAVIELNKDQPVILELISKDGLHGFNAPQLGLRSDVAPQAPARLSFTPHEKGRFLFHCDIFCGSGHDEMSGEIVVVD